MGNNDTFYNMDEVRGWGVRGLREKYSKHITKCMEKETFKMIGGVTLFLIGFYMICDGNEKYGYWEGVRKMISPSMDKAYIEDATDMGYKIPR